MMKDLKYALSFVCGIVYGLSWYLMIIFPNGLNNPFIVIPTLVVVTGTLLIFRLTIDFFTKYWDNE